MKNDVTEYLHHRMFLPHPLHSIKDWVNEINNFLKLYGNLNIKSQQPKIINKQQMHDLVNYCINVLL